MVLEMGYPVNSPNLFAEIQRAEEVKERQSNDSTKALLTAIHDGHRYMIQQHRLDALIGIHVN